ncbi:MAG TPA: MarR family transcriptional regulator [Candidatus Acidoferrales bacterium]|jgi:DNA-binding MarR family transcriptional regulator|nr:MarR family transcriptional regulator [Candidatus Acidoferrales bacterium]
MRKPKIRRAKGSRPLPSLEDKAFISVLRVADSLLGDMEHLLKPAELSLTQYNVLRILRGAGPTGLAAEEIIERMLIRDPDITWLLDRLEARGLVTHDREAADRRVAKTRLAEEGQRILRGLDEPVAERHRQQFKYLEKRQLRQLGRLLGQVRGGRPV